MKAQTTVAACQGVACFLPSGVDFTRRARILGSEGLPAGREGNGRPKFAR